MHLTYEFVRGSMDWPSEATKNWYRQLLKIWTGFREDLDALRRVRRSINDITFPTSAESAAIIGRKEFETILQEKWFWSDGKGNTNHLSQSQISWFWELSLAGNDGGFEEIAQPTSTADSNGQPTSCRTLKVSAAKKCPSPSVGTWLIPLLESPPLESMPPKVTGRDAVQSKEIKVDYKQFCEDLFGADFLHYNHDDPDLAYDLVLACSQDLARRADWGLEQDASFDAVGENLDDGLPALAALPAAMDPFAILEGAQETLKSLQQLEGSLPLSAREV